MDHWSKMHVLFPLMQKSANEVALNLASKVFAYFGPPKILQSDNGREFVNTIVHKLVEDWPGEVTIVNGRARHPQSQGLVERGNAKVEEILACRFHAASTEPGPAPWTLWLPEIQCEFVVAYTCTCMCNTKLKKSFFFRPAKHVSTGHHEGYSLRAHVWATATQYSFSRRVWPYYGRGCGRATAGRYVLANL
jgi:transposase InsO family protein